MSPTSFLSHILILFCNTTLILTNAALLYAYSESSWILAKLPLSPYLSLAPSFFCIKLRLFNFIALHHYPITSQSLGKVNSNFSLVEQRKIGGYISFFYQNLCITFHKKNKRSFHKNYFSFNSLDENSCAEVTTLEHNYYFPCIFVHLTMVKLPCSTIKSTLVCSFCPVSCSRLLGFLTTQSLIIFLDSFQSL